MRGTILLVYILSCFSISLLLVEVKDQVSNLASTDRALVVLVVINSIGIMVVILGLAFVFARLRSRRNAVCSI